MIQRPSLRKFFIILLSAFLGLLVLGVFLYMLGQPLREPTWGLNYSTARAKDLDFDPERLFFTILNDLNPHSIRLPAYWEDIEPVQGQFDFSRYDRMLDETDMRGTDVIIVLGYKQPRWPECHAPNWWKELPKDQQDAAIIEMVHQSIMQLRHHTSITAWQIENEPFFPYGPDCPTVDRGLYKLELAMVRALDKRPLIGTDSGEKGAWLPIAWTGVDILGATMYREVYYDKQSRYLTYPLPAWTYNVKAGLVRLLSRANRTIGVELQAEPWFAGKGAQETPLPEQLAHMNPVILQRNINYAAQTGFEENYLWGVEWWYWMEKVHNDSSLIQAAKPLFKK
jgi:hypothetical protein